MPRLGKEYSLNFYGGEPLLCFGLITKAVYFAEKLGRESGSRPRFSLTTNGSLITAEAIRLFNKYRFALEISFDGTAQETFRQKGSSVKIIRNIKKLLACPDIQLEVNSVSTPGTVQHLSESARIILDLGVPSVQVSISAIERWNKVSLRRLRAEMKALREVAIEHFRKTGNVGIANFKDSRGKGFFFCAGGQDRFAIAPDGGIWGCFLFPGFFRGKEKTAEYRTYYFGRADDLAVSLKKAIPRVAAKYARLSLDNFSTSLGPCLFCPEFETCAVCPIAAALSGSSLGKIPDDICEIQRIQLRERRKVDKELALLD